MNVIPLRYLGSVVFFFDIIKWSVNSPAELRVIYNDSSLESTVTVFFRLNNFVAGFHLRCSSNGVFFISEWVVKLRTYSASFRLLRRFCSSKFAPIKCSIDWMVFSTNPVPVC